MKSKNEKDNEIKNEKKLTKIQRRQIIEKMLNDEFPLIAIILLCILDILLGLSAIGFQIASIIFQTDIYFVGCGLASIFSLN